MSQQRKTLILNGDWLLKKMFFKNHKMVYDGLSKCGAIVGFLDTLKQQLDFLNPDKVIVFWNGNQDGFFKYNAFPDLKLDKKDHWRNIESVLNTNFYTNDDQEILAQLWEQKILLKELLEDLCIRQGEENYTEAVDLMALYALTAREEGEKIFFFGREYDFFQMISDQIYCISANKEYVLSVHNFQRMYGYDLENELLIKCFVGSHFSPYIKFSGITRKKLLKYVPELSEGKVSYKKLLEIVEEKKRKKKLKIYDAIQNSYDILRVNSKVLDLQNPYINQSCERVVENLIFNQLDTQDREVSFVSEFFKKKNIDQYLDIPTDRFFSYFEAIKRKEREYSEEAHEQE